MSTAEELAFLRGRLRAREGKPSGAAEASLHRERDAYLACRTSSRSPAPSRKGSGAARPLALKP